MLSQVRLEESDQNENVIDAIFGLANRETKYVNFVMSPINIFLVHNKVVDLL